jgi:hypothetical protein
MGVWLMVFQASFSDTEWKAYGPGCESVNQISANFVSLSDLISQSFTRAVNDD